MPKFRKGEDELESLFEKWMYVLRNLTFLMERPKALQERVFKKLFRQAEIAQYDEVQRRQYEASLKEYWDYTSTLDTAYMKGERKGREEGQQKEKTETVLRLKQMGLTLEQIAQGADMTMEEVNKAGHVWPAFLEL